MKNNRPQTPKTIVLVQCVTIYLRLSIAIERSGQFSLFNPHSHVMDNKIELSQVPNTPSKKPNTLSTIPNTPSIRQSTPCKIPNTLSNFSVTGFLIQSRIPTSWAVRWSGSDQIEFRTLLSLRPNQPHSAKNLRNN